MTPLRRTLFAGLLAAALPALAQVLVTPGGEGAASEPYGVDVWSEVRFDEQGQAQDVKVQDAAQYSPKMLEGVKLRLMGARIAPVKTADGLPAVFESGVKLSLLITPGGGGTSGGSVAIRGLSVEPLPLKRYAASYPKDIQQTSGWKGGVAASCLVGRNGECGPVRVEALPGMPESVRRFAKASLEGWRFVPQKVGGEPVATEVTVSFALETLDDQPEDFRRPKFDRLIQSR